MKRGSTMFLKAAIILMGLAVFSMCLFLVYTISTQGVGDYFPIVIGMCVSAVPFFYALYQGLQLLNYIDANRAFSNASARALLRIQYCASAISSLYVVGMPVIYTVADRDDAPGVVAMGLVIIFASVVIAVFAALLHKLVRAAIDIQSENDLTV